MGTSTGKSVYERKLMARGTSKKVCRTKIQHDTKTSAQTHAVRLCADRQKPPGHWRPYDCPWCNYWHVGREPGPGAFGNPHKQPLDIALMMELGERALFCGMEESYPRMATRKNALQRRFSKAMWMEWSAQQDEEFHEKQRLLIAKRGVKKIRGGT